MHIVSPAVVKSMCMFRSLYFFACCFPIIGLFFFFKSFGFFGGGWGTEGGGERKS